MHDQYKIDLLKRFVTSGKLVRQRFGTLRSTENCVHVLGDTAFSRGHLMICVRHRSLRKTSQIRHCSGNPCFRARTAKRGQRHQVVK
jgi:hypothetical protein